MVLDTVNAPIEEALSPHGIPLPAEFGEAVAQLGEKRRLKREG